MLRILAKDGKREGMLLSKNNFHGRFYADYASLRDYTEKTTNSMYQNSHIYKGTCLELRALDELKKCFNMDLRHVGRSGDGGIDLIGKWDLDAAGVEYSKSKLIPRKFGPIVIEPLIMKKGRNIVNVNVQCKYYTALMDANKLIETCKPLSSNTHSIFAQECFPQLNGRSRFTVSILCSKTRMTTGAKSLFRTLEYPMIFAQFSPIKALEDGINVDPGNVVGGKLESLYMNPACQILFEGFNMRDYIERMIFEREADGGMSST